jgi:hypothetical protein
MRTFLTTSLALVALFTISSFSSVSAATSVQFRIDVNPTVISDDDDIDRDNLIVISDNEVGYWKQLPSGRWAFRYRTVWYDGDRDRWQYGPWKVNLSIGYGCHCRDGYERYCPVHGIRYSHYMREYPAVYECNGGYRVHQHQYDRRPFYRVNQKPRVEYRVERRYSDDNRRGRHERCEKRYVISD